MNRLTDMAWIVTLLAGLGSLAGGEVAAAPQAGAAVPAPAGVVVSASQPASEAGAAVLARGGNAVDAAVATGFALAVTYPAAGNIGGGGFMVVRLPDGKATTFDFRETAPAAARPDMFLDAEGRIDSSRIMTGYLAVGVPGTVRGFALAHARFGRLPWREVVEPAVQLAGQGFTIPPRSLPNSTTSSPGQCRPFPDRSPLLASRGAGPGRLATGSARPISRPRSRRSPTAAQPNSTWGEWPGSSPMPWPQTVGSSPAKT